MNPSNSAEAEARLRGASDKARKGSAGGARQEHTRSDGKRKFGRSSGQKQEEVGVQTAVVAAAGALTDSEWHVVFSSAAVQPCGPSPPPASSWHQPA